MSRDHLLRLDLETLTQLEVVKWKADDRTMIICTAKGQSEVFSMIFFTTASPGFFIGLRTKAENGMGFLGRGSNPFPQLGVWGAL